VLGTLDLINWILEEGRDNDDLGAILVKFSEWLVAREFRFAVGR